MRKKFLPPLALSLPLEISPFDTTLFMETPILLCYRHLTITHLDYLTDEKQAWTRGFNDYIKEEEIFNLTPKNGLSRTSLVTNVWKWLIFSCIINSYSRDPPFVSKFPIPLFFVWIPIPSLRKEEGLGLLFQYLEVKIFWLWMETDHHRIEFWILHRFDHNIM